MVSKQGYFILGKFDQQQKATPYNAISQAFRSLFRQILSSEETQIDLWRKKLAEAVGKNGRVITNVIPELEKVLGPQPTIASLPAKESISRFRLIWGKFINSCISPKRPLVICFDDLQWADDASLQWLEMVVEQAPPYFLLLGCYREEEVGPDHPLAQRWKKMQQSGVQITPLRLMPLNLQIVTQMLQDCLKCQENVIDMVAQAIYDKTAGNPLFVQEFLLALFREKVLQFETSVGTWCCNQEKLTEREFAPNIVTLMLQKIEQIPNSHQEILKWASCLGNSFSQQSLFQMCQVNRRQFERALEELLEKRLLYLNEDENYCFSHDRVQKACYSLIKQQDLPQYHHQIGMSALENNDEEKLFEILHHLNLGRSVLTQTAQKTHLSQLNLSAGQQAKATHAYQTALRYLSIALELLPSDAWKQHYQHTYDLYLTKAECEYICGHFSEAHECFNLLLNHAKQDHDRIPVYRLQTAVGSYCNDSKAAVTAGLQALKLWKENIPPKPGKIKLTQEFLYLMWRLWRPQTKNNETCLPILHHDKLLGILYLENNLIPGIFIADRLQVLKILTTQSGIALENAQLYENLRNEIAERQALEKKILTICDQEKQRIGQDLHDNLAQCLGFISLTSYALYEYLKDTSQEHAQKVKKMIDLAHKSK